MRKLLYYAISLFLAISCSGFAQPVFAMAVKPAIVDAVIAPGKQYSGSINIKNDEDAIQTYYFSIQKFIPSGTNGQQTFLPPSDLSGLPEWVRIDAPNLTLKPGEIKKLNFSIQPPVGTAPGGNYAAIFVSNQPPSLFRSGSVMTGARTGVLLLVTITGDLIEKAKLSTFSAATTQASLPVTFDVVVQNQGNTHILPEGTISISNLFGHQVASVPLNQDAGRVLPGSTREYHPTWSTSSHQPSLLTSLTQEWSPFLIGPVHAAVSIAEPSSTESTVQPITLYIWPWRTFVLITCLLILIFGSFGLAKRRV